MKKDQPDALTSPFEDICDCCKKNKLVSMYVLQDGNTALVCLPCRTGEKK